MPARRTRRPAIIVTGAAGLQGGRVIRALLAEGAWRVRAMTRDPRSAAALALRASGAEVVRGDLADPATLPAALEGADVVYAASCAPELGEGSYARGRTLLGAIAAAGASSHLVLSSLADVGTSWHEAEASAMPGRLARLEREAYGMGIASTFVRVALPYERFLGDLAPRRQRDGSWSIELVGGDAPVAAVSIEDAGVVVARVVARRDEFVGRTIAVVGEEMPRARYADAMARLLAAPVRVSGDDDAKAARVTSGAARELSDLLEFIRRHTPRHEADIVGCRALHPAMQRFDAWLARRAGDFTRVLAA